MSENSLFRDLIGERDPIHTQSRTSYGTVSGTPGKEWCVMVPDKCSLTRVDILAGTAAVVGATRQVSLKVMVVPSGTASKTFTHKGYCVATFTTGASYARKALFPSSVITLAKGCIVGFSAQSYTTSFGTALGVKLAVFFTKGHVQA